MAERVKNPYKHEKNFKTIPSWSMNLAKDGQMRVVYYTPTVKGDHDSHRYNEGGYSDGWGWAPGNKEYFKRHMFYVREWFDDKSTGMFYVKSKDDQLYNLSDRHKHNNPKWPSNTWEWIVNKLSEIIGPMAE